MSIKPPLICPPDYSIQVFRISECKKASVLKGATNLASLDLNSLNIPINEHTEGTLILKGETERVLNIDDIAEYGPLNETYSFNALIATNPTIFANATQHTYSLYDENLNLIETLSFTINTSNPLYATFPVALQTAYNLSTAIKANVSFVASTVLSTGILTVTAKEVSTKLRHVFTFNTTATNLASPGTLITPYTKYTKGRIKYILVFPNYDKVDVTTCGCANASGDMKSNQKFFQYVNRGEYDAVSIPETNVTLNVGTSGLNCTWAYNTPSDHIGYHFSATDLLKVNDGIPFRAKIESLIGKDIVLDAPIDVSYNNRLMSNVYGPATPRWINVGDFLFLSGATDTDDTDRCFIETIVLKNPHTFDIPVRYMIGR